MTIYELWQKLQTELNRGNSNIEFKDGVDTLRFSDKDGKTFVELVKGNTNEREQIRERESNKEQERGEAKRDNKSINSVTPNSGIKDWGNLKGRSI